MTPLPDRGQAASDGLDRELARPHFDLVDQVEAGLFEPPSAHPEVWNAATVAPPAADRAQPSTTAWLRPKTAGR